MANPQTWTDPETGDVYELIPDAPEAQAPKTWTDPSSGDTYELIPDDTAPAPTAAPKARTLEAPAEQTVASLAFKNNPQAAAAAQSLWDAGVRDPAAFNTALSSKFPQFANKAMTVADIAAARKRDAWFKARGQKNPGNFLFTESTGVADPVAPTDVFSQFGQSAMKGVRNMANAGVGLAGLGADVVGAEETSDYLLNKFIEDKQKIAFNYPTQVDTVQDIGSVGDAAMYASDTLGGLAPQIAAAIASGGVGSTLAKKAAEKFALDSAKAKMAGAATGAFVNSAAQETGSIYGDTYMNTGVKAPVSSVIAGLAAGGLDAITPFRAIRRLGVPAEVITDGLASRMMKTGVKDVFIEGGTEAAQTFIEGLPEAVVTGKSPFTQEMFDAMLDTFVRGAIGGGVTGTVSEGLRPDVQPIAEDAPQAAPEVAPTETSAPVEETDAPLPFKAPDFLNTPAKSPFKRTPAFLNESAKPEGRAAPVETAPTAEPTSTPLAVNKQQAADHINNTLASDWKNAPPITTVESLDELPADVRQGIIDDGAENAKGVTVNGQVYILAHNIKDTDELSGVVYHEALGHAGLGMQFGKRLNAVLEQMYNTNEMVREAADAWLEKNSTQAESPIAHAVEEILAETSEGGKVDAKVFEKIKAFLKQYARRVPGLKNLKYTDKEVIAILSMANNKVISGKSSTQSGNGNRYIRTYHGTPHDFDQFDHSKMGTGEGNQSYGWGTYVAENRKVAEAYKEMLSPSFERSKDGKKSKLYYSVNQVSKLFERLPTLSLNEKTNVYWVLNRMWDKNLSVDEAVEATIKARGREEGLRKAGKILNDAGVKKANRGKLLEVELPDNALWFDFDKSLKEQPKLFEALKKAEELDVYTWDEWQNRIDQVERHLWTGTEKEIEVAWQIFDHLQSGVIHDEMRGKEAHNAISKAFMYEDKEVSEFLKSLGISGNKYLDNFSRDEGDGTSNYVVFDDKMPKIVNKYSKPDNSDRKRGLNQDRVKLDSDLVHNPGNAAKTFLRELGVFNTQELMKMPSSEAVQKAERLGIDHDWIDYYNDAKWDPVTKETKTPTPQPDMSRYMPDLNKYSKPDNSDRPRGLRLDKIAGKKKSFYEPFLKQLEEDMAPRTVQTWEETEDLAKSIGMNVDKVMKLNRGPKAEELTAGINFMMGRLNLISDLSEKIGNGTATERDQDKFMIYLRQFTDMYDVLGETKTTIARTLNIMNRVVENQQAAANNLRYMLTAESQGLLQDPAKVKQLAAKISELKGNPVAQARATKLMTDPRVEDYIQDIWFNSVLSNPITHKINVLGSVGNFLTDLAEHGFASVLGQARRGDPKADRVLAREVLWRFYGAAMGMKGAFSKSSQAFKAGEPVTKIGALERSHNLVKNKWGAMLEGPSKMLAAEDEFMRNIIQTSSYYGMAIRTAAREGLKGDALFTRANQLVMNPTDEMIFTAADYTRALQFVDKPSKPARTYLTLMSRNPKDGVTERSVKFLGSLFTPFIPTADSIFRAAVRRSPLGGLDRYNQTDYKAGGARKDVATSRVIMGSMLAMWVANQVLQGNISGNGPDDYRRRAELEAGGWRANSIKMGDQWVPFDGLDPLAMNLAIVANAVEDYKERKVDNKGYADQAAAAVGGVARALGTSSWLKSLAFITEGINDARTGQQAVENLALNTGTGMIPYSGMGRFMGSMRDPVERDVSADGTMAERFSDRVKSITPFLKSTLPARHDVYGRERTLEDREGLGWLGRHAQTTIDKNETVVELQRLANASGKTLIPPVGKDDAKRWGIERLNSEQYQNYQNYAGDLILAASKEAMEAPSWETLTDEEKVEEIKVIAKDMRAMAREDLFGPLEEEEGQQEDDLND